MGVDLASATTVLSLMLAVQGMARLDNIGHQAKLTNQRESLQSAVSRMKIQYFLFLVFCTWQALWCSAVASDLIFRRQGDCPRCRRFVFAV